MSRDANPEEVIQCAQQIHDNRLGMLLTGRIQNGKLVLDSDTEAELAKKFPNANKAFVAVNAPFDPVSKAV